jgi:Sec-independent protein translocase protein TatA
MVVFLLLLITLLLFFIYRHLTKSDREVKKLVQEYQKQESKYMAEQEYQQALQIKEEEKRMGASKEDIDSQIKKYHKVKKTWNFFK